MTETQHRFLKAIADRVVSGRIAEVRLFPTLRAGQVDSGVAVVAVEDLAAPVDATPAVAAAGEGPAGVEDPALPAGEAGSSGAGGDAGGDLSRLSILTARFRLTVKGPDRGKWEFEVVHDADAPVETIDSVVRGVASRSGEDGEPERLSGEELQRVLSEPWWTAPA